MKEDNKFLNTYSIKLFYLLAGYFLLVLSLYTLFQFIKFKNCLGVVQILSIIIPIVAILTIEKNNKKIKNTIITIMIFLFIIIALPFAYNKTLDMTIDGNSYHKTAIAYIKNGWNPLYESTKEFASKNNNVMKIEQKTKTDLWIEHYPKATWITAATIYNMTGNIESGKCITVIFAIMLFIIAYNCLNAIMSRKWSVIISILTVLNPITITQFFSYYVDSLMGILFTIELLLLFLINPKKTLKENMMNWLALGSICLFFSNIKFTGLLASGVIAAVFYFYWLIKYRKEKESFQIFKRITIPFVIIFVLAITFIGANSYVKNTIDHHNPLYPIVGKDKVDIITTMQPKSFEDKNMLEKFCISLMSKTENVTYANGEPELKLPFMVYQSELDELINPDTRIGGFGPLFGLIVVISIILIIPGTIILYRNEKKHMKFIFLPAIAIILSMILLGENWWARYIPQFYLLPIGTIILYIYIMKYFKRQKIARLSAIILCTSVILNISLFLPSIYTNIRVLIEANQNLKEMKQTKNLELKTTTQGLYGYYYTLNDNGIKYKINNQISEETGIYKYNWRIMVKEHEKEN